MQIWGLELFLSCLTPLGNLSCCIYRLPFIWRFQSALLILIKMIVCRVAEGLKLLIRVRKTSWLKKTPKNKTPKGSSIQENRAQVTCSDDLLIIPLTHWRHPWCPVPLWTEQWTIKRQNQVLCKLWSLMIIHKLTWILLAATFKSPVPWE